MTKVKYLSRLEQVPGMTGADMEDLKAVENRYAFWANTYYLNLIDWNDPDDPIRRIIIPSESETQQWGRLDASNEDAYTRVPGLEHKYEDTAVLLVNDLCGGFCRFCFRKRLFLGMNDEVERNAAPGLDYIREHPEIDNVLLTGGDPLLLSTKRLRSIISELRRIEHVKIIRIGSKLPVFNPHRILDDPGLLEMISEFSTPKRKIYIMVHFNHPREITQQATEGVNLLLGAGAVLCNQTPLLRGVNDNADVLTELFNNLSYIGVAPYYVFICRPTMGNATFAVSVEDAIDIFENGRMGCSGLAGRVRLAMSHASGKIEVLGKDEERVYFRYHRAADEVDRGRFLAFEHNPEAYWFDDYSEPVRDYSPQTSFSGARPGT